MPASEASSIGTTSRPPCCRASRSRPEPSAGCRPTRSRRSSSNAVRDHLNRSTDAKDDAALIHDHVVRVEVQPDRLIIELARRRRRRLETKASACNRSRSRGSKTPSTRRREILVPDSVASQAVRPIRAESRALLVASIARGRRWLDELIADPDSECRNHRRARGLQRTQGQHDDLAGLPRTRSRQGSHRGTAAARHGRDAGSAICPPNGPASASVLGLTAP